MPIGGKPFLTFDTSVDQIIGGNVGDTFPATASASSRSGKVNETPLILNVSTSVKSFDRAFLDNLEPGIEDIHIQDQEHFNRLLNQSLAMLETELDNHHTESKTARKVTNALNLLQAEHKMVHQINLYRKSLLKI